MPGKAKSRPHSKIATTAPRNGGNTGAPNSPVNSLRDSGARWQRAQRFGWDKGGSKGGRR